VDRKKLEQDLAHIDREIARHERHIERERQLIAKLETGGRDASEARERLVAIEAFQVLRLADRELFRQELALFRQKLKRIW
jgi:hypothetical protein